LRGGVAPPYIPHHMKTRIGLLGLVAAVTL